MSRGWAVAVSVVALAASAATPRHVTIKKKSGEKLEGNIVSELESGYLLKLDKGGTVKVPFDEIADLNEPGPKAPAAKAPAARPVEAPSPPPEPPVQAAGSNPNGGPCGPNESYVTLKGKEWGIRGNFCVDRTEVTVDWFQACVNAGYCKADGEMTCGGAANWGRPDRANHPINCVNALQAEVYCAWKKSRLPSQEELWEIGALAGGSYPWGDGNTEGRVCWSGDDKALTGTCPVGSFPRGASPARVFDLAGNVSEWTSSDKRGNRIFVGGAWNDTRGSHIQWGDARKNDPTSRFDDVGFRCIRQLN